MIPPQAGSIQSQTLISQSSNCNQCPLGVLRKGASCPWGPGWDLLRAGAWWGALSCSPLDRGCSQQGWGIHPLAQGLNTLSWLQFCPRGLKNGLKQDQVGTSWVLQQQPPQGTAPFYPPPTPRALLALESHTQAVTDPSFRSRAWSRR